jgi:hypothetical protein
LLLLNSSRLIIISAQYFSFSSFCEEIVFNKKSVLEAYIAAGYKTKPHQRWNCYKLFKEEKIQKRILEFLTGKTEGEVREAFGALQDLPSKNEQILTLTNKVHELELQVIEINKILDEIKLNFIEKEKEVISYQKKLTTANTNLSEQILKNEELDRLAKDNKNLYLQKNDAFNNLNEIFEVYKETHPDEVIKFSIINFIKSLFKK